MKSHVVIESTRLLEWCAAVHRCVEHAREQNFLTWAEKRVKPARRFLFWKLKPVTLEQALVDVKRCTGPSFSCSHCTNKFTGGRAETTAKDLEVAARCARQVAVNTEDLSYMRGWTSDRDFENIFREGGYR